MLAVRQSPDHAAPFFWAAFQVIGTPVVKTADDSVTNYLKTTCGINTSPSP